MSQAKLTTKGQVTIPKVVREQLDLKAGDRIDFIVSDSGEAVIRRVSRSVKEIQGLLSHRARTPVSPVSVEEMDEAVRRRFKDQQV